MKKYLFTVALILLGWGIALAGKVTVSGHLTGFKPNSLVRIIGNADPFSRWKTTLATTRTDDQGNFSLTVDLDHPIYAQLAVNLKKGNLFLFPDGKYSVVVARDTTAQGSVFDRRPLNLHLKAEDGNQTRNMGIFNQMYNDFLVQNFRSVYQYHNQEVLRRFQKKVDSTFSKGNKTFLKNYIRYSMASLEWGVRKFSASVFAGRYFVKQPVLYDNVQYAELFDNFFEGYFDVQPSTPVTLDKIAGAIASRDLTHLDDLFQKDSVLKQDNRVRQLAEMVLLRKLFYQNTYQQYDIEVLFRQISRSSPYIQNRQIAAHWLKRLTYLTPGTAAPAFQLPDFNGNERILKNWKGKFVLLAFYKTNCPLCLFQWAQVKDMQEKLGSEFVPVVIVSGSNVSDYQNLYVKENGQFTYLLLGNDILLPEKYQVETYPSYVLVNPDGTIAMAPAPMPQDNAQRKFSTYMEEFKKGKNK